MQLQSSNGRRRQQETPGDWLKLSRKILDSDIWLEDAESLKIWITLLVLAVWKRTEIDGVSLEPGQVLASTRELAQKARVSHQRIRTFLRKSADRGEIRVQVTQLLTQLLTHPKNVITLCNWGTYQNGKSTANTAANTVTNTVDDVSPLIPTAPARLRTGEEQEKKSLANNPYARSKPRGDQNGKSPIAKSRLSVLNRLIKKESWKKRGWTKEVCYSVSCAIKFYSKLDPEMDMAANDGKIYWRLAFLAATGEIPFEIARDEVKHSMAKQGKGHSMEHPGGPDNVAGLIYTVIGSRIGECCGPESESFLDRREWGIKKLREMLKNVDLPPLYQDLLRLSPDAFDEIAA